MSKFAGMGIAADVPSRLELVNPTTGVVIRDKDGNPAWIDLLSSDSQVAKQHERTLLNKRIQNKLTKPTAEQIEADATESYVVLTKGWNLLSFDGEPIDLPCNPANARDLYSDPETSWVREAVQAYVNERANFKKG